MVMLWRSRPGRARTRPFRLVVVLVALAAVGVACVVPDPGPDDLFAPARDQPAASEYQVRSDILYHPELDLALDLYEPVGVRSSPPVIVYVHGGGWVMGDRKGLPGPVLAQLRRGFVVASVDYRLATGDRPTNVPPPPPAPVRADGRHKAEPAPFPAAVLDIKHAVQWLQAQPEFASSPVVMMGESAGGNLATVVAVSAGDLEPVPGRRTVVSGAVSIDGPQDLRAMWNEPWGTRLWYGTPYPENSAARAHFGLYLNSGEMVGAYLGCDDAQTTDDDPEPPTLVRPTPECQARVDRSVDAASSPTWIDATDPPLYFACLASNYLLPDCSHDAARVAGAQARAHGDDADSAWVDQIEDTAASHFNVDEHLDLTALNRFLDRFRPLAEDRGSLTVRGGPPQGPRDSPR